jgi:hypothetical protein
MLRSLLIVRPNQPFLRQGHEREQCQTLHATTIGGGDRERKQVLGRHKES